MDVKKKLEILSSEGVYQILVDLLSLYDIEESGTCNGVTYYLHYINLLKYRYEKDAGYIYQDREDLKSPQLDLEDAIKKAKKGEY